MKMRVFHKAITKHHSLLKRLFKVGIFCAYAFAVIGFIPKAFAQTVTAARPGLISFTAGDAYLDDQAIHIKAQNYPFLNEGQLLRTRHGRAEMQLTPTVLLRLGEEGNLRLNREGKGGIHVLLQKGAAIVEVINLAKTDRIQIQCAGSMTELKSKGVYRFDTDPGRLRVYGGKVEVSQADIKVRAESGKAVNFADALAISKFSVKSIDSLHMWAARRSFFLFTSNPNALTEQSHWEISFSGRSRNTDFHVDLSSPIIAQEYARRFAREIRERVAAQADQERARQEDIREYQERQLQMLREQQQQQQQQQNKKP
jgi:hypothetical protein